MKQALIVLAVAIGALAAVLALTLAPAPAPPTPPKVSRFFLDPGKGAPIPESNRYLEQYNDGDETDWAPELQRFLDDPLEPYELRLRKRDYSVLSQIKICRPVKIVGEGFGRSRIRAHAQLTPLFFAGVQHPDCSGQLGSARSTLDNVSVVASGGTAAGTRSAAILVEANISIENVLVSGAWAHGIHISADVNRDPPSNANLWWMHRVRIVAARHAGVYVQGGDSNAGVGNLIDASANCVDPDPYTTVEPPEGGAPEPDPDAGPGSPGAVEECAGIVDASFLGNTWIGPHTASNGQPSGAYPGYRHVGPSSRSVFLGAYRESNQDVFSPLDQKGIAIGGLSNWIGGGLVLGEARVQNAKLIEPWIRPGTDNILMRIDPEGLNAQWNKDATTIYGNRAGSSAQRGWAWDVTNATMTPRVGNNRRHFPPVTIALDFGTIAAQSSATDTATNAGFTTLALTDQVSLAPAFALPAGVTCDAYARVTTLDASGAQDEFTARCTNSTGTGVAVSGNFTASVLRN